MRDATRASPTTVVLGPSKRPGVFAVFHEHLAVDDRLLVAAVALHESPPKAIWSRPIRHPRSSTQPNPVRVPVLSDDRFVLPRVCTELRPRGDGGDHFIHDPSGARLAQP